MGRHGLSVTVIGGGIGGLTAGLSLLEAGLDVHVYEQSSRISEVGAGIAVSPNATRVLYRLGLAPELAGLVSGPAWWQRRWKDGRTLSRTPLGTEIENRVRFTPLSDASRRPRRRTGSGSAGGAAPHRTPLPRRWSTTVTRWRHGSTTARPPAPTC